MSLDHAAEDTDEGIAGIEAEIAVSEGSPGEVVFGTGSLRFGLSIEPVDGDHATVSFDTTPGEPVLIVDPPVEDPPADTSAMAMMMIAVPGDASSDDVLADEVVIDEIPAVGGEGEEIDPALVCGIGPDDFAPPAEGAFELVEIDPMIYASYFVLGTVGFEPLPMVVEGDTGEGDTGEGDTGEGVDPVLGDPLIYLADGSVGGEISPDGSEDTGGDTGEPPEDAIADDGTVIDPWIYWTTGFEGEEPPVTELEDGEVVITSDGTDEGKTSFDFHPGDELEEAFDVTVGDVAYTVDLETDAGFGNVLTAEAEVTPVAPGASGPLAYLGIATDRNGSVAGALEAEGLEIELSFAPTGRGLHTILLDIEQLSTGETFGKDFLLKTWKPLDRDLVVVFADRAFSVDLGAGVDLDTDRVSAAVTLDEIELDALSLGLTVLDGSEGETHAELYGLDFALEIETLEDGRTEITFVADAASGDDDDGDDDKVDDDAFSHEGEDHGDEDDEDADEDAVTSFVIDPGASLDETFEIVIDGTTYTVDLSAGPGADDGTVEAEATVVPVLPEPPLFEAELSLESVPREAAETVLRADLVEVELSIDPRGRGHRVVVELTDLVTGLSSTDVFRLRPRGEIDEGFDIFVGEAAIHAELDVEFSREDGQRRIEAELHLGEIVPIEGGEIA
jgi:hypothetical protein